MFSSETARRNNLKLGKNHQKQKFPVVTMYVKGSERNEQSQQRTFHRCFLPSFSTFGQTSIYGRSSIEITHFVLIHLQTWLPQVIPVLDWSISKNLLIWNCFAKMNQPYLLIDRDEMSNLYRGPSIDASYQVSVHLAKRLQKRRFF
jgi:hypothetical protein